MRKEPTKSYDNVQVIEHFGKPAFAVGTMRTGSR